GLRGVAGLRAGLAGEHLDRDIALELAVPGRDDHAVRPGTHRMTKLVTRQRRGHTSLIACELCRPAPCHAAPSYQPASAPTAPSGPSGAPFGSAASTTEGSRCTTASYDHLALR